MIQPWMISTLPRTYFRSIDAPDMAAGMTHGATQVSRRDDEPKLHRGSTIWLSSDAQARPIALAWDWVEIRDGVVAMVDPMAIISNLECLEDTDQFSALDYKLLSLNQIVYQLDWQSRVCRAIKSPQFDIADVGSLPSWMTEELRPHHAPQSAELALAA